MGQSQNQDWYITYDESILLKNKSFPHKLALAVQLKQYISIGSFPKNSSDITNGLVSHLSGQLDTNESILNGYDWSGRTAERHRVEILNFLGVEKPNEHHRNDLIVFLVDEIVPMGNSRTEIEEISSKWFLGKKLVPPTEKVLSRTISTALSRFENGLFNKVASLLGHGTTEMFDSCLETAPGDNGSFSWLRSDPGRVGLATVLDELEKLAFIEGCGLPVDHIGTIHSKIKENSTRE
jgi:hypothetical protein